MRLSDGYHDLPAGKVAFVVTSLAMASRPASSGVPVADPGVARSTIRPVVRPELDWYRDLYRRVGSDWLWASRLRLSDEALTTIIHNPAVSVWALVVDGCDEGLLELDFRVADECELAFFGLTPSLIGRGAGRLLMDHAIAEAWARPIGRFWVHTCTGDHPQAPSFYVRSGFVPYRIQVEVTDDPRLEGLLPTTAAPHVALLTQR